MYQDDNDDYILPPDPIEFREGVRLPDIPLVWTTNLNGEHLAQACAHMVKHGMLGGVWADAQRGSPVRLPFRMHQFEFAEGACFAIVVNDQVTLIYRSQEQWERFAAHTARLEHAENVEKERRLRMRRNYRRLLDEANSSWKAGDAVVAERRLLLALALFEEYDELRIEGSPHAMLLWLHARDSDPTRGLEYLDERKFGWQEYEAFARCYGWHRPDPAFEVYRHATELFPDQPQLYTSFALLAASKNRPDLAIQVCEEALARGLHDHTQSGFAGRIRRIRKKFGKPSEP